MKSRFDTGAEGLPSLPEGQVTESEAQALRALSEEISREFAPRLERTTLVLYDRDPGYLQAQWSVTPLALAEARRLFPGDGADLRQVLRLCHLDRDGHVQVVASAPQGSGASGGAGADGFALPGDGAEYSCELGLESDAGGWLPLARSNRVRLADPRLPASRIDPVPDDAQSRHAPLAPAGQPEEIEDMPVEAALAAVSEPLHPAFPNLELDDLSPPGKHPAPLEEAQDQAWSQDQRPEFPPGISHDPAPDPETGAGIPSDAPVEAALAAVSAPLYPVFPNLEPDDKPLPGGDPVPLEGAPGRAWLRDGGPEFPSGVLWDSMPDSETTTDLPPGAELADMPPPLLPSSPGLDPGTGDTPGPRYDPRAALSSAVLSTGASPPMPDLELHAELIVQGRAAADSTLDLFGHPITVGADGRFYIRRAIDIAALESLAAAGGQLPWQGTAGHG